MLYYYVHRGESIINMILSFWFFCFCRLWERCCQSWMESLQGWHSVSQPRMFQWWIWLSDLWSLPHMRPSRLLSSKFVVEWLFQVLCRLFTCCFCLQVWVWLRMCFWQCLWVLIEIVVQGGVRRKVEGDLGLHWGWCCLNGLYHR